MNEQFDELEFARCIMVLLAVVLGFVIVLQFAVLVRIGEIKRSQQEQRQLTSSLIDYTLKTSEQNSNGEQQ